MSGAACVNEHGAAVRARCQSMRRRIVCPATSILCRRSLSCIVHHLQERLLLNSGRVDGCILAPRMSAALLDNCIHGVLACHRFDGFEAALKTASQEIADTAEDLAKPQRPATSSQLLAARSEAAKDQLKANFMVSSLQP